MMKASEAMRNASLCIDLANLFFCRLLELPLWYRRHDSNMTNNIEEMELYKKKLP